MRVHSQGRTVQVREPPDAALRPLHTSPRTASRQTRARCRAGIVPRRRRS